MSKRVLCKFFAHGACLKGDHCEFSHDWKAPPNNICTFYQKGVCAYGSRCRYDHVKVARLQSPAPSSSAYSHQHHSVPADHAAGTASVVTAVTSELSASGGPFYLPSRPAWDENFGHPNMTENDDVRELRSVNPAGRPICSFAAAGNCPHGEKCPHIHGDLCPTCGKHCLHPFRPQEREEHVKTCEKMQRNLEALKHSQEIECSVCLERVLSKSALAERKFGILSECDHPFCISCIRNWRSSSPTSGMDVNSALRACPICRKLSYFVIPSVIWYCSKVEKQEIVDSYKAKLKSIDCKHFDFGNGTCPFGTSCFYKHTVNPGSVLWNATLNSNLYSSRFLGMDQYESTSNRFEMSGLEVFDHLYSPHIPLELEEQENDSDIIELENEIAEGMAEPMAYVLQQGFDTSDLSDENNDTLELYFIEKIVHAYRDGRLEEVILRHLGAEDGNAVIAKSVRLSDFLSNLHIR